MIAAVRGVIEDKGPNWLLVGIGGVSLHISVPLPTVESAGLPGAPVRLFTHLHVREDILALYGFQTAQERDLFVRLMTVSGVGPRGALALLSVLRPWELARAVAQEDARAIRQAPGFGPRIAERVIVELKGKLDEFAIPEESSAPPLVRNDDLLDTLMALGYSQNEVRRAMLSLTDFTDLPIEERLRRALQALGQGKSG